MTDYLSAADAANRLGVSRQTLYAYVSRGLLRAHETSDPRQRRYASEAVARLAEQRRRGRRPREVAKATLDWGLPVLESAITLIQDGQSVRYRGVDAADAGQGLRRSKTWRHCYEQLPAADFGPDAARDAAGHAGRWHRSTSSKVRRARRRSCRCSLLPYERDDGHCVLGSAIHAGSPKAAGRWCASCWCMRRRYAARKAAPLHRRLAKAWRLDSEGANLIRMALVLCADHELNASSFTARCVASTGASLRAAVIGGLAALSGSRHGGMTGRIETFWRGLDEANLLVDLRRRLAADDALAGFGHPLYPAGRSYQGWSEFCWSRFCRTSRWRETWWPRLVI